MAEGHYGPVRSAVFRRLSAMPAGWFKEGALSGGAILDLHIHDVDFIHHLFGKPAAVFSRGYSKTSGQIDHILTQYFFNDVPLVSAEGGWCMSDGYPFAMKYTVNFECATADYDSSRSAGTLVLHGQGQTQTIETAKADGFVGELAYFIECVKTNNRPERRNGRGCRHGVADHRSRTPEH